MRSRNALTSPSYPQGHTLDTARALAALAALAQPTRLAIDRLHVGHAPEGLTPGDIAKTLDVPPATLSFHLKELATAGLAVDRRESRNIRYRADLATMGALVGYLTDHCCRATGRVVDAGCGPACEPPARRTVPRRGKGSR